MYLQGSKFQGADQIFTSVPSILINYSKTIEFTCQLRNNNFVQKHIAVFLSLSNNTRNRL